MFNRLILKIIVALSILTLSISQASAVTIGLPITRTVTVQPIILSNDDGSNTATFFGSLTQKTEIENFIDATWSQAGINVDFLNAISWNNSFANNGASGFQDPRPNTDLKAIIDSAESANLTHPNPDFINIFFVNLPAGFSPRDDNHAAGLAFIGANGVTQFVGTNLLGINKEIIADVVAHEIGHNLGLFHTEDEINNLMSPDGTGNALTNDQIAIILNSDFANVSAVPVPAAMWLFGSGLIALASFSRNKI